MLKKTPQKNLNIRPMSSYISKSYRSLNLQQSPKISSKKFRRNITINLPENSERLFSLRDIDLKKTIKEEQNYQFNIKEEMIMN